MGRHENRFEAEIRAQGRAVVIQRMVNPTRSTVAPNLLVSTLDLAVQSALEEMPQVLWDSDELMRLCLPEAQIVLALNEAGAPGQAGLLIGVVFEGEAQWDLAEALAQLLVQEIHARFPALEPADPPDLIDPALDEVLMAPLAAEALPPVDLLADLVWQKAQTRRAAPERDLRPLSWSARLQDAFPQIQPLRHVVRAVAVLLLAIGLVQSGFGHQAQAEPQIAAP